MTVIVGLETTVGEKAIVLGTDKLIVNGDLLVAELISYIAREPIYSLELCFKSLQERGLDKVKLKSGRKIKFSEESNLVLAQTGLENDANKQIETLLLNPEEFLKNNSLIKKLLFPLGCKEEFFEEYFRLYKKTFNLDLRIKFQLIPEVRRIFDIHAAKRRELDFGFFKIAYWDRNYSPVLSEYLFGKVFNNEPKLFDIALTGAITPRQYFAKGCGAEYALEYMRKRLGTSKSTFFYPTESSIGKEINLPEAVDIVKEAIEFTNGKSDFCKGFDYVILRKDGIETHFSNKEFYHEFSLVQLIERRMGCLRQETTQLERIKSEYLTKDK